MEKLRVALLFGGRSAEHDVACVSARHVAAAMSPSKYQVVPIGITKEGAWVLPEASVAGVAGAPAEVPAESFSATGSPITIQPGDPPWQLAGSDGKPLDFDVVFPVLHGPNGEDGTVQGLCELAGLPYVGAGVAASAIGMDKQLMKMAFHAEGLSMTESRAYSKGDFGGDVSAMVIDASQLGFPLFTKPASMGSSVGISRCIDNESLRKGIDLAFDFDAKVIVEREVRGREIECAVLGNENPEASVCGEIISAGEFYDYESKYIDAGSKTVVPAPIPEEIAATVREYALRAFRAIGCSGMARVDCFFQEPDLVLINEINTIPGFTTISMFPMLWQATGVPYSALIDRLIELALQRHAEKARFTGVPPGK